jgi:hypothetical protein
MTNAKQSKKNNKRKQLRKQRTKRNIKKGDMTTDKIPGVYVQTIGSSETYVKNNNKKSESKIKWMGDYNGEDAKLQVDINNDKKHKVFNFKMNNEQLSHLLGMPTANMSLEDQMSSLMEMSPNMNTNKVIEIPQNEVVINTMKPNDIPLFLEGNNIKFVQKGLRSKSRSRN